jgi:hypothetical protein
MNYFLVVILMLVALHTQAEEIFPSGCQPLMLHDDQVMLSTDKPILVMIHNLSTLDLWMTHPVSEPTAGWSSRLQAGHWSALALDKKTFELSCIESRPGHEQQVPCQGLLAACQWTHIKLPKQEAGTFWAGEDMSLSALTAHVGSRGFVISSSTQ